MGDLLLASAGDDIKLWDCNGYGLVRQFNPHSHNVSSICWSHDNAHLASASVCGDKIVLSSRDAGTGAYEFAQGERRDVIAFNSMSRYMMGGGPDGVIHVWDLKTRKFKKSYKEHKGAITALQFNWNDSVIASASNTGDIILYNVVSGLASNPLHTPHSQAVHALSYSHFRKSLLGSCSESGGVTLWDSARRSAVHSFQGSHSAPATALAFSPFNEMLFMSVGLDKRIVCYDVHNKKPVKQLVAESPLTSLDLLHNGATLAVGSTRGHIYIYDLRHGATPISSLPAAHTAASVQCLKFQYSTERSAKVSAAKKSSTQQNNNTKSSDTEKQAPSTFQNDDFFSPVRDTVAAGKASTTPPPPPLPLTDTAHVSATDILSPLAGGVRSHVSGGESVPVISPLTSSQPTRHTYRPPTAATATATPTRNGDETATKKEENGVAAVSKEDSARMSHAASFSKLDTPLSPAKPSASRSSTGSIPTAASSPSSLSYATQPSAAAAAAAAADAGVAGAAGAAGVLSAAGSLAAAGAAGGAGGGLGLGGGGGLGLGGGGGGGLGGGLGLGGGGGGGAEGFQEAYIRSVVEDAVEEAREKLHQDIVNLHMDMFKQFLKHQYEMRSMLEEYSLNPHLLAEIERLKAENERLKKTF